MTSTTASTTARPGVSLLRTGAIAAVVATIGTVLTFLIASALGVALDVPNQGDATNLIPLNVGMVAIATIVPAFLGIGLLAALTRFVKRPVRTFLIIGVVFTLLSLAPLASVPALETQIVLGIMHLVAAAGVLGTVAYLVRD